MADRARILVILLTLVLGSCWLTRLRGQESTESFLWYSFRGADGREYLRREPYLPHAGDLIFYSDHAVVWRILYALARTSPPYHVGMVVRLPDGRPAVLEAGPYDCMRVYLLDLEPRLHSHNGVIWVRRLRVPLSEEQSERLTAFALKQAGKRFALGQIALEITPFRAHGPLRSRIFGDSRLDHPTWFCSELAVAAGCIAGLFDPQVMKPNTIYPRDLFIDRPFDLRPLYQEPLRWTEQPDPPLNP